MPQRQSLQIFQLQNSFRPEKFQKAEYKTWWTVYKKNLPHIIRRQLQDVKQGSGETVEEFADIVLEMTTDGYPDTPGDYRQTVAIDASVRGCYNKQATMDKNPLTLDLATQ